MLIDICMKFQDIERTRFVTDRRTLRQTSGENNMSLNPEGGDIIHKIITCLWKAQRVPQLNNVAHPKHPEEEETSPNRNHIITGKQQQTN